MAGYTVNVPAQPGFDATFVSKDSPIGRDLSDRATRVQLAAKAQVGVARPLLPGDNPRFRPIPGGSSRTSRRTGSPTPGAT
jgi:hypothetical protein